MHGGDVLVQLARRRPTRALDGLVEIELRRDAVRAAGGRAYGDESRADRIVQLVDHLEVEQPQVGAHEARERRRARHSIPERGDLDSGERRHDAELVCDVDGVPAEFTGFALVDRRAHATDGEQLRLRSRLPEEHAVAGRDEVAPLVHGPVRVGAGLERDGEIVALRIRLKDPVHHDGFVPSARPPCDTMARASRRVEAVPARPSDAPSSPGLTVDRAGHRLAPYRRGAILCRWGTVGGTRRP